MSYEGTALVPQTTPPQEYLYITEQERADLVAVYPAQGMSSFQISGTISSAALLAYCSFSSYIDQFKGLFDFRTFNARYWK